MVRTRAEFLVLLREFVPGMSWREFENERIARGINPIDFKQDDAKVLRFKAEYTTRVLRTTPGRAQCTTRTTAALVEPSSYHATDVVGVMSSNEKRFKSGESRLFS